MKMLKYIVGLLLVAGVVLASCKKDPDVLMQPDLGYNYFPIDVGRYVIYEVDSIDYDDVSHLPDTTRYLLKEVIASTFIDNSGREALRLERFIKVFNDSVPYDSMNWVGPRVWYANRTSSTAEKVEENIRYIKLVFPLKKGQEWNGNSFNTLGAKDYEIISVDEPDALGSLSFDSVVTVKQNEQIDFIQHIYEEEKFARNVGLIYRLRDSIYTGGSINRKGYSYTQKIVDYGQ